MAVKGETLQETRAATELLNGGGGAKDTFDGAETAVVLLFLVVWSMSCAGQTWHTHAKVVRRHLSWQMPT